MANLLDGLGRNIRPSYGPVQGRPVMGDPGQQPANLNSGRQMMPSPRFQGAPGRMTIGDPIQRGRAL